MDFQTLETTRLYLREITTEDANDMYEYLSDDMVTRYLGNESLVNIDGAYDLIKEITSRYKEGRVIRWGIILKENNKLIGTIGFDLIQLKNKRAEIGYIINSNYWRQGLATEAINKIIEFGFTALNFNRIGSIVFPENTASLNLLKKAGFTKEGLLREYIIQNNIERDVIVLSLLKKEYLSK